MAICSGHKSLRRQSSFKKYLKKRLLNRYPHSIQGNHLSRSLYFSMQFTSSVLIAALAIFGPLAIVNVPSTGVNAIAMPNPSFLRDNALAAFFKRHDGEHHDDVSKRDTVTFVDDEEDGLHKRQVDDDGDDDAADDDAGIEKRHHLTDGKAGGAAGAQMNMPACKKGKGGKGKRHHLTDGKACGGKKKGKGKGKAKAKATASSTTSSTAATSTADAGGSTSAAA